MRKIDSIPRLKNIKSTDELERGELGLDEQSNLYIKNYSGKILLIGHENQIYKSKLVYKGMSYGVVKELIGREETSSIIQMGLDSSFTMELNVSTSQSLEVNITNVISYLEEIYNHILSSVDTETLETYISFKNETIKFINFEDADTNLIKRVLQDNSDYPSITVDPATSFINNYSSSATEQVNNTAIVYAFLEFGQKITDRKYVKIVEYVDTYGETKYVTRYYFEDKYIELIGDETGLIKTKALDDNGYFNTEYNYMDDVFTYLYPFNAIREVFLRDEDKGSSEYSDTRKVYSKEKIVKAPLDGEITKLDKEKFFVELPVFYKKIYKGDNGNRYLLISDGVYESDFTPVESHVVRGKVVDKIYVSQYISYLDELTGNSFLSSKSDAIRDKFDVKYIKYDGDEEENKRYVETSLYGSKDWFGYLNTIWLVRFCGNLDLSGISSRENSGSNIGDFRYNIIDGKGYIYQNEQKVLRNAQCIIGNPKSKDELYFINTEEDGAIPNTILPIDSGDRVNNVELSCNSGDLLYVIPVINDISRGNSVTDGQFLDYTGYYDYKLSLLNDFRTVSFPKEKYCQIFYSFKIDGIINPISFGVLQSCIRMYGGNPLKYDLHYRTGYINILTFNENYNALNLEKTSDNKEYFYLTNEPYNYYQAIFSKGNSNIQHSLDKNVLGNKKYTYIESSSNLRTITGTWQYYPETSSYSEHNIIRYDVNNDIRNKSFIKNILATVGETTYLIPTGSVISVKPGSIEIDMVMGGNDLDGQSVSITYLENDIKYGNDYFYEDVVNSKGYDLSFKIKKIEDSAVSIKRYSCYYFMKEINGKACMCLYMVVEDYPDPRLSPTLMDNDFVFNYGDILFSEFKINNEILPTGIYQQDSLFVIYFELNEPNYVYNEQYKGAITKSNNLQDLDEYTITEKMNYNYKKAYFKDDDLGGGYNDSKINIGCKSPMFSIKLGDADISLSDSDRLLVNNTGLLFSDGYTRMTNYGGDSWFVSRLVIK